MSKLTVAMSLRQSARNAATGKYSVMTKPEGGLLDFPADGIEVSDYEWLKERAGSALDPRQIPQSPFNEGVLARVKIKPDTAQAYLDMADMIADDFSENPDWGDLFPGDAPEDCTFELEETVRSGRLTTPKVIAIDADGKRLTLVDFDQFPDYALWTPEFAAGDGDPRDRLSLRHVNEDWNDAVAADRMGDAARSERSHELLAELGWETRLYHDSRNEWVISPVGRRNVGICVRPRENLILDTRSWKPAGAETFAAMLDEDKVEDQDVVDMLAATANMAVKFPTERMKWLKRRQPLIDELSNVQRQSQEDLSDAQAMLAIHRGEAEAPKRGRLVKQVVALNTAKSRVDIHQKFASQAQEEHDVYAGQAKIVAASLPPLLAETVQEQLESLKNRALRAEHDYASTRMDVESKVARWENVLSNDEQALARRAEINERIKEFDQVNAPK